LPTRPPAEGQPLQALALGGVLLLSTLAVVAGALWLSDIEVRMLVGEPSPAEVADLVADGELDLVAQGAASSPAEEDAPTPVRLHLPTLGVETELIALGLEDDGALEVPEDPHVAGWWAGGADPGERGPAVVVGHVDSHEGPGVFVGLGDLAPGDRVLIVREDGTAVHFDVERLERHPKDDFPTEAVYGPTDAPTLRLVTCSGEFDPAARSYEDNLVVFLTIAGWST
jgi:hypothetical protein